MTDFTRAAEALAKAIGGNADDQDVIQWLDTGYAPLNAAISGRYDGGWPMGRIVEVFGPESSGKTWLATQAIISAQKMGGAGAFMDHERSFKRSLAEKLGLDPSPGKWIFQRPKTYEQSVTALSKGAATLRTGKFIPPEAPIVWVFDSLASMIPAQMVAKDADEVKMNDTLALAKLTSTNFKVLASIAEEYNVLIMFLNQIRQKPGVMYGDPTTTPGGNAPKFYASVRIQLGAKRIMKDQDGEQVMIGSEVSARCVKNKVNRPWLKAKWRFMFNDDGSGRFDVSGSLVEFALEKKILHSSGPRVTWTDGKSYFKSQLIEKITNEGLEDQLSALIVDASVAVDAEPEQALGEDDDLI